MSSGGAARRPGPGPWGRFARDTDGAAVGKKRGAAESVLAAPPGILLLGLRWDPVYLMPLLRLASSYSFLSGKRTILADFLGLAIISSKAFANSDKR